MSLQLLKKEEKRLFDTYKSKRSNQDKINHLREMANVIEKIEEWEKDIQKKKQN